MSALVSMRTYFARPGQQPVDVVTFAGGILSVVQRATRDQLMRVGFAAATSVAVLEVTLGDPAQPAIGRAVGAYVNGGEWKARCPECGGCEYVDLELRLFMCCTCWNAADDHAWRLVLVPIELAEIEAALLVREPINRGWDHPQTVAELEAENMLHGLPRRVEVAA